MVTIQDIKDLLNHPAYLKLLSFIKETIHIEIDGIMPPLASLNSYVEQLNKANLSIEHITSIINQQRLISYFVKYHLNEEYEEDSYLDSDEDQDEEIILPFYKDFVISSLIIIYLIQFNQNELADYIKKLGFKNPNKETQRMLNLYEKASLQ